MKDLKRLVVELEVILNERGGSLDAPAREALQKRLDFLKQEIKTADAPRKRMLYLEALNVMATLVSLVTNVMELFQKLPK